MDGNVAGIFGTDLSTRHFVMVPRVWMQDTSVSLEARGLLAQVMCKEVGVRISISSIAAENGIGRDKARRVLHELLDAGYLWRGESQSHDSKGHLSGYEYAVSS